MAIVQEIVLDAKGLMRLVQSSAGLIGDLRRNTKANLMSTIRDSRGRYAFTGPYGRKTGRKPKHRLPAGRDEAKAMAQPRAICRR